jgi:hypothetical protein
MTTIAGIFAATGPITFAAPESARTRMISGSSSGSTNSSSHYADLATIHRRVGELGRAMEEAQSVFETLRMGTQAAGRGEAVSASALGIDPSPRTSTLDSTEEVNTVPTSYSPHGPSWTGASTTPVTVTGTYNGDYDDDTLRFKVTQNRTVGGSRNIRIKIYDSAGTRLQNLNWAADTPADTPKYSSKTGLWVSLGSGITKKNDEFFVDVSTTVDSEIDPDKPFDGVRNDVPELEPGLPVSAGSFTVNGETIAVNDDDTVNDVLDRINASAAGVTAIYDPSTELVSFERDDTGALDITLAGDTSGFLDSMKLTGATVVMGSDTGELDVVMQDVAALSGTAAGSITINEVDIAIDPGTDSLNDVMDAINASEAGVTASFDEDSLQVTLASESASGAVVLEDGGTNFTTGIEIDPGTYQGRRSAQLSKIMARKAGRAMANVAEAYEKLQATELSDTRAQNMLGNAISAIDSAITTALGDHEELLSDAGLSFDLDAEDADDLMDLSSTLFERALRSSDGTALKSAMVGSMLERDDGLLGMMGAAVDDLETTLRRSTGDVGVYLSTYA